MKHRIGHTLATLKKAAAKYGATVEDDSATTWKTYQVVAPQGKNWHCDGIHTLKLEWDTWQPVWRKWRDDEIRTAIERMSYGLDDCPADCECRDE